MCSNEQNKGPCHNDIVSSEQNIWLDKTQQGACINWPIHGITPPPHCTSMHYTLSLSIAHQFGGNGSDAEVQLRSTNNKENPKIGAASLKL